MSSDTDNTRPGRRWYQFRLRTLLIVMTLCAIPLSWVGSEIQQRRREQKVVAWVEEKGGEVRFARSSVQESGTWWHKTTDELFGAPVMSVVLPNEAKDLTPLSGLKNLGSLYLNDTQVSDLSPLSRLKNLHSLFLNSTQVSDLSQLAKLTNLKQLSINDTQVSDLTPLAGLKSLTFLALNHTQVSDLSPLSGLENLGSLYLSDTQVSDLSPLFRLKNLQSLGIGDTPVSNEQIQLLQQALPTCTIYHSVREEADGESGEDDKG